MKKKEIRIELRDTIDDTCEPYGWSDARLDGFIDEAMDQMCSSTGFFVDFQNYPIVTEANVANYSFEDLRVIEVLELWDLQTNLRLTQFGEDNRPDFIPTLDVQYTTPYAWQTDQTTGYITFYPTPVSALNYQARVWRYARTAFSDLGENDIPEIPKQLHRGLIEYAAYKAYSMHDRERADQPKAMDHFRAWMGYVSDGKKMFQRMRAAHPRITCNQMYNFR